MSAGSDRQLRRRDSVPGCYSQSLWDSDEDDPPLNKGRRLEAPSNSAVSRARKRRCRQGQPLEQPVLVDAPDDDVPLQEFFEVRWELEAQEELGLRVNSQYCRLSWAEFSSRVPEHWTTKYPHVCPLCRKRLSSRFSLSRHYIDVHHREEKRLPPPARCPFCAKVLYNQSTLNRHLMTVHRGPAAEAYIKPRYYAHRPDVAVTGHPDGWTPGHELSNGVDEEVAGAGDAPPQPVFVQEVKHTLQITPVMGDNKGHVLQVSAVPAHNVELAQDAPPAENAVEAKFNPLQNTETSSSTLDSRPDSEPDNLQNGNMSVEVQCPLCDESAPTATEAAQHVRSVHTVVCQSCGLRLPEPLLERHTSAHQLKLVFRCAVCGERAEQQRTLQQHLLQCHLSGRRSDMVSCRDCGPVPAHSLLAHCLKHTREDALTSRWCNSDELTAGEWRGLEAGRLLLDAGEAAESDWPPPVPPLEQPSVPPAQPSRPANDRPANSSKGQQRPAISQQSRSWLCPVCAGAIAASDQLAAHIAHHGQLPLLACLECALTFWTAGEQASTHRCRRLLCLLCGKQVLPRRVAAHWRMHAEANPLCALVDDETGDCGNTLTCERCGRTVFSVSQLRRHRLHVHGLSRGPLPCSGCHLRFFLERQRSAHHCLGVGGGGGGAQPSSCAGCGACPAVGRAVTLVSAAGTRARLSVCARCSGPLTEPQHDDDAHCERKPDVWQGDRTGGVGACGDCDTPLPAGASALLTSGAGVQPAACGAAVRPLCVPCSELWLRSRPECVWRPEAWLGAVWCHTCCRPQHSLQQLRVHCLREHADTL